MHSVHRTATADRTGRQARTIALPCPLQWSSILRAATCDNGRGQLRWPPRISALLVAATLAGCASTLGTIPGVSLAVDAFQLFDLSTRMENEDVPEEMLRELESRPLPLPRGLSYDVAVARRGLTAFMRGNNDLAVESSRAIQRHGRDKGLISMMMGLEAAAEASRGKLQAASLVLRERERRGQAI